MSEWASKSNPQTKNSLASVGRYCPGSDPHLQSLEYLRL